MGRPSRWPPTLHRHAGGQAFVRVSGRDIYLGRFGSDEAANNYAAFVRDGKPPERKKGSLTVAEAAALYLRHAERHYRDPDGNPTQQMKYVEGALAGAVTVHGSTRADAFRGKALKDVRDWFVKKGWCRTNVNAHVRCVTRAWKWLAGEELVPPEAYLALKAVDGLRAGRCDAPERPPVRPVPVADVERTLPFLRPALADMVRVQLYAGTRPGEACRLRADEVEKVAEDLWVWRPARHKTAHHGKARVVLLGPKAIAVLLPRWPEDGGLFFRPGKPRGRGRGRKHTPRPYTRHGYRQAVARACARAGVPHWHPAQLRKAAATMLAREYDLTLAKTVLGHASLATTELYAERDLTKAAEAIRKVG